MSSAYARQTSPAPVRRSPSVTACAGSTQPSPVTSPVLPETLPGETALYTGQFCCWAAVGSRPLISATEFASEPLVTEL